MPAGLETLRRMREAIVAVGAAIGVLRRLTRAVVRCVKRTRAAFDHVAEVHDVVVKGSCRTVAGRLPSIGLGSWRNGASNRRRRSRRRQRSWSFRRQLSRKVDRGRLVEGFSCRRATGVDVWYREPGAIDDLVARWFVARSRAAMGSTFRRCRGGGRVNASSATASREPVRPSRNAGHDNPGADAAVRSRVESAGDGDLHA